jgi:hypothetical protein
MNRLGAIVYVFLITLIVLGCASLYLANRNGQTPREEFMAGCVDNGFTRAECAHRWNTHFAATEREKEAAVKGFATGVAAGLLIR